MITLWDTSTGSRSQSTVLQPLCPRLSYFFRDGGCCSIFLVSERSDVWRGSSIGFAHTQAVHGLQHYGREPRPVEVRGQGEQQPGYLLPLIAYCDV